MPYGWRFSRCNVEGIPYICRNNNQSGAFLLLEMFWSADQNKQLSNQSVNLDSREARPIKLIIVCRHYLTVDQVITDQY